MNEHQLFLWDYSNWVKIQILFEKYKTLEINIPGYIL